MMTMFIVGKVSGFADESAPLDRQLEPQVALHGGSPFV
jgi:hypothetical protein